MACVDCFNNCDKVQSDKCVKYTGPDIPFLDVCTGDPLSAFNAAVVANLTSLGVGENITISNLTSCDAIEDALGDDDPTLPNLLQAAFTVICVMREELDEIGSETPFSINAACLELAVSPTRDQVIQALATKVCELVEDIEAISTDYVTSTGLCDAVTECLGDDESSVQEYTKMPKYVAMPYHGPLSVFDANGAGLAAFGYDKVYICLGQTVNGFILPDYRGRSAVGANTGLPGGAMDSAVDPTVIANFGYNISQGTKKGNFTHTLTTAQLAAHTHNITDPGHKHDISYNHAETDSNESGASGNIPNFGFPLNSTASTLYNTTGITIAAAGASQPHNITQPSMGTVYIMYVPS